MWAFPEIMLHVLGNNVSHVLLAEQDHLVQALGPDREHEPLEGVPLVVEGW
jgi:hypothetical protein